MKSPTETHKLCEISIGFNYEWLKIQEELSLSQYIYILQNFDMPNINEIRATLFKNDVILYEMKYFYNDFQYKKTSYLPILLKYEEIYQNCKKASMSSNIEKFETAIDEYRKWFNIYDTHRNPFRSSDDYPSQKVSYGNIY